MLNFKSFRTAGFVLVGIELIHMIRKGQFAIDGADAMSFADQFSMLVGMVRSKSYNRRNFQRSAIPLAEHFLAWRFPQC
jgi:hypothetical protein